MDPQYTGQQIAQRRKALGLTQKALAQQLHITDKAVSKWERGLNFPDLGLLENLAAALGTTSAALLGLENAGSPEILDSLAQLSADQLAEARRDLVWTGWGSLLLAALLVWSYHLFGGKSVPEKQQAYQLLHAATACIAGAGLVLLIKYEEIRKFDVTSLFFSLGAFFSGAFYLLYQFGASANPPLWLALPLLAIGSGCAQLLFLRILRPRLAQALPAFLSLALALQGLRLGYGDWKSYICALTCVPLFLLSLRKRNIRA